MKKSWWESRKFLFVMSLVCGTTLWFYVINSEPIEVEKEIAIEFSLPKGLSIQNNVHDRIKLKVRGARVFINTLENISPKAKLEVKSRNRDQTLSITDQLIELPFGLKLIDYFPKKTRIVLGQERSKDLPISFNGIGEIPKDLYFFKKKFSPSSIHLKGSSKVLGGIESLTIKPIVLSELGTKGKVQVELIERDPRVSYSVDEIFFEYELRPTKANITLRKIPIRFLSSRKIVRSSVKTVAIDVLMPDEKMSITERQIQVIADVPEGKGRKHQVKLRAVLPDGIHLVKIIPSTIDVFVK